jgi:uncharacterized membrane protein SpoIIM required for sporulation
VPEITLKSARFRGEREASWRELERLIEACERRGAASLSAAELNRLPALYRGAVSSLSVARAISLDKNLLAYLTALAGRAYLCVYGGRRRAGQAIAEFFRRRFPREVRRHAAVVAAAMGLLLLGIATGYRLIAADPERYYDLVDAGLADGRDPAASTSELRAALYHGSEAGGGLLGAFSAMLATHNARIGILCFALGMAWGVPVAYLLFANGLMLGAMAALYASRGLGAEFWAWVLPHGITELTAVALCGAAGLALGRALLFPGRHTRLQALAARGRDAAQLVAGAVAMLFGAALIEGIFRQRVHDPVWRWLVAAATLGLWSWYFLPGDRGGATAPGGAALAHDGAAASGGAAAGAAAGRPRDLGRRG